MRFAVTAFFLVFSVLEDSGYFPRMAIMLNRVMKSIGLNGKAVLPMILGLGCATMATMTTRIVKLMMTTMMAMILLVVLLMMMPTATTK